MTAEPLLRLSGVETRIGPYHILHGVDLAVEEGAVTMLLGRNGAGKTTTLRTIMGLWRPSAGEIRFAGQAVGGRGTADIARQGIAYVPEEMAIFSQLTVEENLRLAARRGKPDALRLAWIFELFPVLQAFWRRRAGILSGGQKQMLAIARAVIEPTRLVIVDEPTKGLAPAMIDHVIDAFRQVRRSGATVLMVEQNFHCARSLGDKVAVMDQGRVVHAGAMADFAENPGLQHNLLGLSLDSHQ
jgi:branched-chain amino acid transport system ATP-binding protein